MSDARTDLLERVVDDLATHGIGDRSLRQIAASVGTSHRMLIYHFGSREGLVAAVVDSVEASQRETLRRLAETERDPGRLVMALWREVSSERLRPFVRLFFETVAGTQGSAPGPTEPWLDDAADITAVIGAENDPVDIRLGIAVTRGLLVDVLATGDVAAPTEALERFVEMWDARRVPRDP